MSRVLVVDDEPSLLFLHRTTLESAGHQVVEASNGGEALERIREAMPDLVVSDLMMPVMDGRELIRRLRADAATRVIPVIIVSAVVASEEIVEADAALTKPCDPDKLLALVDRLTGGRA
jgi:CheY-like chemotaxis protein